MGAGGYGSVERAYDLELGVEVAIKRISLECIYDLRDRTRLLKSARTEVAAASRIQHPGVVRVYGMLIDGSGDALVIEELVEGQTLRSIMGKPIPVAQALDLITRVAFALAAVHAANIVHRDVKPENIILRDQSSPVLVDFGVAVISGQHHRLPAAGTRNYMPPEQIRGHRLDGRADLYALGVIAHEMLLGLVRRPAEAGLLTIGRARRYRRDLEDIGVDRDTSKLLAKLLSPFRCLRPRSAAMIGAHFSRCGALARPRM